MFASEIPKRETKAMTSSRWCWHLDGIFVKINGDQPYLWRAVGHGTAPPLLPIGAVSVRDKGQHLCPDRD
ncbi:hypothetical protein SAMN04488011_102158 [Palleronia pelagia]|uniref:Transposase n=1 Tax=Palleronia pelagia TaxID=387096 RepID=A0A1H8D181_9RHOB|nr:hypothetical protein SAMN04488011_102158 [Palleronia pelagia]